MATDSQKLSHKFTISVISGLKLLVFSVHAQSSAEPTSILFPVSLGHT